LHFDVVFFCHSVVVSETSVKGKGLIRAVNTNTRFGVLPDSLIEEVWLTLETDCLHPFEGVPSFEVTVAPEAEKESVGTEFDVSTHHGRVHPYQFNMEDVNYEFHFDPNRTAYNFDDVRLRESVDQL
jgi:hypothetical protein